MANDEPSEPSLPPLKGIQLEGPATRLRKRVREAHPPTLTTSSDPAVFSSDDDPDVTNYAEGRRKKRYVGSWFQYTPASSDSAFSEDRPSMPAPKPSRAFERNLDSGVYLASDGAESDSFESLDMPVREVLPKISASERALRAKIDSCVDSGKGIVDHSGMYLEELSGETVAPLSQFTYIPNVQKGVAFVQEDPKLQLYLSQNLLTRLPGSLFDVTHLTTLSLRGNQLTEVPQAIYKLRNLQELNLSQNRLQHLPVELLDLLDVNASIRTLAVWPNPLFRPAEDFEALAYDDAQKWPPGLDLGQIEARGPRLGPKHPVLSSLGRCFIDHRWILEPRLIERRVGRSPIQRANGMGRVISEFTVPALDLESLTQKRLPVGRCWKPRVEESDLEIPPEQDGNVDRSMTGSQVPSLVEAVLRQIHKTEHISDVVEYISHEMPHLSKPIERIIRQKEAGGLICSRCRKAIVVPVAEWIEWRELARLGLEMDKVTEAQSAYVTPLSVVQEEKWVPFLHRACSSRCGPRDHYSAWDEPETDEGWVPGPGCEI
jgi:hypothetical protein